MADDGAYEIMPYKEIVALKKEIESLKRNSGEGSSQDLVSNMSALTKSMNSMLGLFKQAADEMRAEETTEEKLSSQIKPLMQKIDAIIDQNKTIAEGMVAIADMISEQREAAKSKPVKNSVVQEESHEPAMPPMPDSESYSMPPGMSMPPPMPGPSMPPPMPGALPPLEEKPKKGIFSFGR